MKRFVAPPAIFACLCLSAVLLPAAAPAAVGQVLRTPPLLALGQTLPAARSGRTYLWTLKVEGGKPPYRCVPQNLGIGTLALTTSCKITGRAPVVRSMSVTGPFRFKVQDSSTPKKTSEFPSMNFTVLGPPMAKPTPTPTPTPTPARDFALTVSPTTLNVTAGGPAASTVVTDTRSGFNGSIHHSVTTPPAGVTISWGTFVHGSTTMSVTADSTAKSGTTTLTITATGGSITHTSTVTLVVTGAPVATNFSGTWTGTYTGSLLGQGCKIATAGNITLQLTQTGSSVTGTIVWQEGSLTWDPTTCAVTSRSDAYSNISGTVTGTTLSAGTWNLQLSGNSLSGAYQGSSSSATISVHR